MGQVPTTLIDSAMGQVPTTLTDSAIGQVPKKRQKIYLNFNSKEQDFTILRVMWW